MKIAAVMLAALACLVDDAIALEKWGPTWSELTGTRYYRAKMYLEPAIISAVDGRSDTSRIVKIAPGKHDITVQSPTRKGFAGSDRAMSMDIAPCKRYYINAQFKDGVTPEWDPVVSKVEAIAGCKLPKR